MLDNFRSLRKALQLSEENTSLDLPVAIHYVYCKSVKLASISDSPLRSAVICNMFIILFHLIHITPPLTIVFSKRYAV